MELKGVFRCLKHVELLDLPRAKIEHWCNNEQVVRRTRRKQPPTTPNTKKMVGPDGNILLAIHHMRSKLQHSQTIRHVYAHQDTKVKKKSVPPKQRPRLQVDCDAERTARTNLNTTLMHQSQLRQR